jgi:hypothetical protein
MKRISPALTGASGLAHKLYRISTPLTNFAISNQAPQAQSRDLLFASGASTPGVATISKDSAK